MNDLFPTYLTNQSPILFFSHFSFVLLIFLGQYFLCRHVQDRWKIFANVPVESFLFVPFFLFPFSLLFCWMKWGNWFYGISQMVLITSALIGIYTHRNKLNPQFFKDVGATEWICYGVILVLGVFGWLVPIPDNYNGHGHVLWNVLMRMMETGGYDILDRHQLSSDDIVQLFWPPHLTFLLRFYCLKAPLFFYRPALLVPMLVGFLIVQVVKDICKTFQYPKVIGLLGFLGIIGTYFNVLTFFEIQYDALSLLMLLYFFSLLARIFAKKEALFTQIILLLFFSFLIRKQVFIILFFATVFGLILQFKNIRNVLKIKPSLVLLGFIPLLVWSTLAWIKYDNPMWPQSRGAAQSFFLLLYPRYQRQKAVAVTDIPLKRQEIAQQTGEKEENDGARVQYFKDFFQSHFPNNPWMRMGLDKLDALFLFCIRVGPLSLAMASFFLVLLIFRKIHRPVSELMIIEGALAVAWIVGYFIFFQGYRKFPQYFSAILLLPTGFALYFIQKKFLSRLSALLAVFLFLNFNVILFGHRNIDFHFLPLQIFLGQKTFMEKLAYKSNKSVFETKKEAEELYQAYNSGKRILHIEVEPGGLLPSLMGREFFGDAFYFSLFNYQLKDVMTAKNKESFAKSLEKRNIGFVFFPQRDHGTLEDHPLFLALRKFQQQTKHHLLVPSEEVLEIIQY